MAVTKFQPEVWSATLLSILEKSLVYAGAPCVNRNYEGDIANYGDTVHIVSVADPTISTYTKDTDLTVQVLTDSEQLLTIDQAKAFAFEIDDIDMRQVRSGGALMTEAAQRAAFGLRDVTDQYVAGLMKAGVNASNALGAITVSTTATDAYDKVLVPLAQKLDEANVPTEGRFVVVPPAFYAKLRLDGRFIKANESGRSALHNGDVGDAAGFQILTSNNAPAGATTGKMVIAGSNIATSFAEQISKVEAFRPEKRFADALKGLHLYGAKVVRDTALASADVTVS
jgi:N4-gp56 family major capsid protein